MTVAAVEAVPEATAAARAAPAAAPGRARSPRARAASSRPLAPQDRPRPAPRMGRGRSPALDRARRAAPTSRTHRGNYQGIILAEFVAAVLLVAATPFATKKSKEGLSPYAGKDLLQLMAITLTYFVLALVSATGRGAGRWAAMFGGLILLTVGLSEAAHLAKVVDLFGVGTGKTQTEAETTADQEAS